MTKETKPYGGSETTQAHLRELWTILGASTQQEARRAVQQLGKDSQRLCSLIEKQDEIWDALLVGCHSDALQKIRKIKCN
jgi:hypothetical protein